MKYKESGAVQTSALVAVIMTFLFIGSLVFGLSMLVGKSDLQKNLDKKVQAQVGTAVKQAESKKDTEFAAKEKSPVKTYTGPTVYGTVSFDYPKTFSGYVDESLSGAGAVNAYFHPGVVPKDERTVTYALRFQVLLKSYDSAIKSGKAASVPFRAANVSGVLGVRISGEIETGKQGSVILLPLRDKTIKIWTENKDYLADFDTYVVPSLRFVP